MDRVVYDSEDEGRSDLAITESPAKGGEAGEAVADGGRCDGVVADSSDNIKRDLESAYSRFLERTPADGSSASSADASRRALASNASSTRGGPSGRRAYSAAPRSVSPDDSPILLGEIARAHPRRVRSIEPEARTGKSSRSQKVPRRSGTLVDARHGSIWDVPDDLLPAPLERQSPETHARHTSLDDVAEHVEKNDSSSHDTIMDTSTSAHSIGTLAETSIVDRSDESNEVANAGAQPPDNSTIHPKDMHLCASSSLIRGSDDQQSLDIDELYHNAESMNETAMLATSTPPKAPAASKRKALAKLRKRKSGELEGHDELETEPILDVTPQAFEVTPARRSTRSKSLQQQTEEVSVSPAVPTSKSRSKRRKTNTSAFPVESVQLTGMGFSCSQAELALIDADGDLEAAIELLTGTPALAKSLEEHPRDATADVTGDLDEAEQDKQEAHATHKVAQDAKLVAKKATRASAKKKPKSKAKHKEESALNEPDENHDETDDTPQPIPFDDDTMHAEEKRETEASNDVRVVIPVAADSTRVREEVTSEVEETTKPATTKRSTRRAGRKQPLKSEETIAPDSEDELQSDKPMEEPETHEEANEIEAVKAAEVEAVQGIDTKQPARSTKKQGRGRPKRNATTAIEAAVADDVSANAEDVEQPTRCGSLEVENTSTRTPLQETCPNKASAHDSVKDDDGDDDDDGHAATPKAAKKSAADKSSPSKGHSPLPFGRVPLKVGLSRRMRVEPLLKIIRK